MTCPVRPLGGIEWSFQGLPGSHLGPLGLQGGVALREQISERTLNVLVRSELTFQEVHTFARKLLRIFGILNFLIVGELLHLLPLFLQCSLHQANMFA